MAQIVVEVPDDFVATQGVVVLSGYSEGVSAGRAATPEMKVVGYNETPIWIQSDLLVSAGQWAQVKVLQSWK